MDLDARPYRAFVTIAELESFSRAAEILHITQPALSGQMREFERRLGFVLFTRTTRRVRLTPEGRIFLDKAKRFVLESDWINQAAREITNTKLRIGTAHFTSLIAERCTAIDDFLITHPDTPVSIVGRSPSQLMEDLGRNDIDIAITLEPAEKVTSLLERSPAAEVERIILARRDVRLFLPREWRRDATISGEVLRGIEKVATINRGHGIAISEMIMRELMFLGIRVIHPPEADGASLARYAALKRIAAIDLGWFDHSELLRSHAIEDMHLQTVLVVLARRQERREGADLFMNSLKAQKDCLTSSATSARQSP